jgi:hypothetical protein
MKKWIAAALVLVLILAAIYFGSPLYAARSLRNAALTGDSDAIAARVDFPAVRKGLKRQFGPVVEARVRRDLGMDDGVLAPFAMMVLPRLVDKALDAFVTPEAIAALMRGRKPGDRDRREADPDLERKAEYLDLDHFRVGLRDARRNQDGASFLFERRGFASWKLVEVGLPPRLLD